MHFIEISNIFKSEKKRYKVTAVLKITGRVCIAWILFIK